MVPLIISNIITFFVALNFDRMTFLLKKYSKKWPLSLPNTEPIPFIPIPEQAATQAKQSEIKHDDKLSISKKIQIENLKLKVTRTQHRLERMRQLLKRTKAKNKSKTNHQIQHQLNSANQDIEKYQRLIKRLLETPRA